MSQLLDAFGIDWKLLLAQAVNFAIVLVALRYFLYTPVLTMLEKRRQFVAKGVEDARQAETLLAGADSEAEKRVRAADEESESIVERARHSANDEKSKILDEAEERAFRVESDAEARAKELTAKALRESEREVARLAVLAAEKVMRTKANV
jgi:F-type H+-transporting ATPase subunit b